MLAVWLAQAALICLQVFQRHGYFEAQLSEVQLLPVVCAVRRVEEGVLFSNYYGTTKSVCTERQGFFVC